MYICIFICVRVNVFMHVCMYVWMYIPVCMYIWMYVNILIFQDTVAEQVTDISFINILPDSLSVSPSALSMGGSMYTQTSATGRFFPPHCLKGHRGWLLLVLHIKHVALAVTFLLLPFIVWVVVAVIMLLHHVSNLVCGEQFSGSSPVNNRQFYIQDLSLSKKTMKEGYLSLYTNS